MTICIDDLNLDVIIGILDSELHAKQAIILNIEMDYEFSGTEFIDYVGIVNQAKEFFDKNHFGLLEDAIIGFMGHLKFIHNAIDRIKIQISKPNVMPPVKISVKFEKFFTKP